MMSIKNKIILINDHFIMISNSEISRIDVHFINCKIFKPQVITQKEGSPTYTYDQ